MRTIKPSDVLKWFLSDAGRRYAEKERKRFIRDVGKDIEKRLREIRNEGQEVNHEETGV